ncbi:MAG: methylmalonyl-CoA mutase family protein, partial [Synergistetes bacterium]|nr:methylmalonyl-CoA mutase family protein [Synergistota bacterium]
MFKEEELQKISQKRGEWEEKTKKVLQKHPEMRDSFRTLSEIPVERVYTPEHVKDMDYVEDLGFPGDYPYTRGVQPTMYRGRLWTLREYAGFATAEESNKRYKYLIEQGQMGLSVAFDLPTQIGYDSDHPMAHGEVGKVGVAIDSLKDMEILFDGIPLDKVSTSMTINAPATVIWAMYIAVAEKQGVPMEKLRGTIQNDILKEYIARGTYIFPPEPSLKLIRDTFEFGTQKVPLWNTISISGYHIREAGSTAVQEVAFTLADGIAYVNAAVKAGLDPNKFGQRLSFFFNAQQDFLEEIAKFRAARRLWARIMRERFGVTNPRALTLRFHTQTAGVSLTAQQPMVNIIRTTLEALSAVLGGTQSMHTNSYDEALALPSEESVTIAMRTQQVIAYESGVTNTVDPLAGSYYIEYLTNEIEKRAMEYIEKIDELGGMLAAIEKGYPQQEIQSSAYNYQKAVESGERIVVGVNKFVVEEEEMPKNLLKVNPEIEVEQSKGLKELREGRDNLRVKAVLEDIRKVAKEGKENLMPYFIEAVKA